MKRVCIIGAGISGLATAVQIQQKLRGLAEVTIMAEEFSPHTTGDGAAGFIELHAVGGDEELLKKWCKNTLDHCLELFNSEKSVDAGISSASAYLFYETNEDRPFKDFVFDYRWLTKEECKRLFPQVYDEKFYILHITTLLCECRKYLPFLMRQFKESGGQIVKRKVQSLSELSSYDVVVNCSGLGSRSIFNDPTIRPLRGQAFRVKAPWLKHCIMNQDQYVLPCANNVLLGGTHQLDNWNTEPCEKDAKRIWNDCLKLVPSLKHAVIENEWVGLRPSRPTIRLEREMVATSQKTLSVVHNYGHGGSGISLHWGCANEAANLVVDSVTKQQQMSSKL